MPGRASLAKADIQHPGAVRDVLDGARQRYGRVDILVHNAASFHPMATGGAAIDAVHRDIGAAIDPLLGVAGELAAYLTPGAGRVIAISSNGARQVVPRYVSLGAAKAALESVLRYLAVELAPHGIYVNAVSTAKLDKGVPDDPAVAALAARTPGGRLTRPDDVAGVVALLCTDEARWIHGQVITVDGGLGLRG
jgi:enoyl-[acyl-carrier protein] reductase III